ncbi:molybdopterin-dependent oxidoreductase [Proteinivorax hydrogeniformans]|uniref:Molybdopterin-dependent oxidoreductase n=1 Tax=Proteinivorax hydrogeniformans TaxID=1826727 RepID=A0AAU8HX82_9FIRM
MKIYNSACPLDCWDACGYEVYKDGDNAVVRGKKEHPITNGFVCKKAQYVLERVHHKSRITSPLLKEKGKWRSVSWDEALNLMSKHIKANLKQYGPKSIAHYYDSGAGGTLKNLEHRFFNLLGGVTEPSGSLCWAAGMAAIKKDFGAARCHNPSDIINSDNVVIWGRNVTETNIHLMPFIKQAQKAGATIICIDPTKTKIADISDLHISVKPSSDGFFALSIAKQVLNKYPDALDNVSKLCNNVGKYQEILSKYSIEELSKICGVSIELIEKLAVLFTENTSSFYLGYGMQRYFNSGNSIRAINSLAMLTGNIGIKGGGVNYADTYVSDSIDLDALTLENDATKRFFPKAQFPDYILSTEQAPINFMYVSRANPAVTLPNTATVKKAFEKVDFVVGCDVTFTDTMSLCDLVLPATTSLEEEDIIYTSMWHRYINYLEPVFSPIEQTRPEWEVFADLSARIGLKGYPQKSAKEWLTDVFSPLKQNYKITIDDIREKPVLLGKWDTPFKNGNFKTENGRFNLLDCEISQTDTLKKYELFFMTPHPKNSLHSQFQEKLSLEDYPVCFINPNTAKKLGLKDNKTVMIGTQKGSIKGILRMAKWVHSDVLFSYEGRPWGYGNTQNIVTYDGLTDIGEGTDMYGTVCKVTPI